MSSQGPIPSLLDASPPLPNSESPPLPDAISPSPSLDSTPPAPPTPSPLLPSPSPSSNSPPPAPSIPASQPPSPPPSSDSPPPAPSIPASQPPSPPPSSDSPPPTPAPQPPSPPPSSNSPPPTPAPQPPSPPPSSNSPPPTPAPQPPSPSPSSNSPPLPPPPLTPAPQPPSPSPSSNPPPPQPPSPPAPQPPSSSPSSNSPPPSTSPSPPPPAHQPPSNSPPPPSQRPPSSPPLPRTPPSPSVSPPQILAPPPSSSSSHISTSVVVGVAIGSVAVLAVFGLLWLLFARRKKRTDPYGTEGYYLPRDGHYAGPGQSGQQSNPSAEHFPFPKPSATPLAAVQSMSNSSGLSSSYPQQVSTSGSGGFWPNSSGPVNSLPPSSPGIIIGNSTSSFTYEELAIATNGFSTINLLGQGGFGYVHKGILPNGKIIAVKSLKADSGQGAREFQAEVETISRVHHKHLVSLVGYCVTGSQKLLVYEFVANKTLEFHLHGKGQPVMDWPTRLKLAVGAAKGLAYLHEDCHPKIIHRDIKAANILLDFKFEAMVADFGLAKFTSDANTHVSTRVMGTFGYLAPEYANSGKLTEKSDVFSFGVLLLELITGRRPVDNRPDSQMEDSLVDWARPLLSSAVQDGNFDSLIDPRLESNYNYDEMGSMITCAASCVRHSARRRPRMSQIVRALEGNLSLSDLNDGVRPGFSSFHSTLGSSDIDNGQHKEEMQRFRKMVFASDDYTSTEFGGTTSEFGS